jgi:hypothetical protein
MGNTEVQWEGIKTSLAKSEEENLELMEERRIKKPWVTMTRKLEKRRN